MELNNEQIIELKQIELNILKQFIEVCNKLNIQYFVIAGTLLGTVRHNGFIPWDDDIDVILKREDFELFRRKAPGMLPDYLFCQDCFSDEDSPIAFLKIRDTNTEFVESAVKGFNINHGIFIDVFSLDKYPQKWYEKIVFKFKNKLYSRRIFIEYNTKEKCSILVKIKSKILRLLYPDYRTASRKRYMLYKNTNRYKSDLVCNHCGAWGEREIMPESYFRDTCELQFESISVKVPIDYDKVLACLYGDYMKLPPIEERCAHHYIESFKISR